MTKEMLVAKLSMAINLASQTKALLDNICEELAPIANDKLFDIVENIQTGEVSDISVIIEEINKIGCFNQTIEKKQKQNEFLQIPEIKVDPLNIYNTQIAIPLDNGDKLAAYIGESDFGTYQAGTIYYTKEDIPMDLSMAEIKQGELAKIAGLKEKNQDIDLYVWSNPYQEDYTIHDRIAFEDILAAFKEQEQTLE